MDNQTLKIVQTYRTDGIQSVENILESYLVQKAFWLDVLKDKDTNYGYYENIDFLFVANKSAPNLSLFKMQDGHWIKINQTNALVGSGKGDKKIEGDLTTPIGVYDIVRRLDGLDPYYGPMAFATSYPNVYDKIQNKTGYGIWIHGLPLNKNRDNLNTKGCIAIDNKVLTEYDKLIHNKRSLLITYEKNPVSVTKEELAILLSDLYRWRDTWIKNDLKAYMEFYDENFIRYDGMKISAFRNYKKQIFNKNESKKIILSKINIAPYPNENGEKIFEISFLQDYSAFKKNHITYASVSKKELYVKLDHERLLILTEK